MLSPALRALLLAFVFGSLTATARMSQDGESIAEGAKKALDEWEQRLCKSTDEYIKTMEFLRKSKELQLPENAARQIADRVSRGCDGASERFSKVLLTLRGVGVSDPRALEIALRFSSQSPEVQKNFTEIFSKSFLAEFFDYDYAQAVALAADLSEKYLSDPARVREDFVKLTQFCKESKSLDLPIRVCAEFAIKMARLSEYYPDGVREPFMQFYKKLREDRDYSFDIKGALDVSYRVLKNGPRAVENFVNAYQYAIKKDGLDYGRKQALAFALRMASRSFDGDMPPSHPGAGHAEKL